CAQAGGAPWVAAHDRDAHRIVEATGQDDTDQCRAAVTGDERNRRRPLAVREQPCPPECLERLSKEKQEPGRHEQSRLAARERPRSGREVTRGQKSEDEHDDRRPETHAPARPPRVAKLPERTHQQPVAAFEHDRCSRDCDRRQRIPLRLDVQRWGLLHALPSRSQRQHATSRQRRLVELGAMDTRHPASYSQLVRPSILRPRGRGGTNKGEAMHRRFRRVALAVSAVVLVAIAGGVTYAVADIGGGGVISACYKAQNGQLRLIDPAADQCLPSEKPISWNQTGTQGPPGPTGAK